MRPTLASSPRLVVLVVVLACLPSLAHAFFEQFFQHQSQQEARGPPSHDERLDAVSCSTFVCPDFSCVATPRDCACPSALDYKCLIGTEGAYVCARDCDKVRQAAGVFRKV